MAQMPRRCWMRLNRAPDAIELPAQIPGVAVDRNDPAKVHFHRSALPVLLQWLQARGMTVIEKFLPPIPKIAPPEWYAAQALPAVMLAREGRWQAGATFSLQAPGAASPVRAVPFQLQGVAQLADRGGAVFHWPTGTGKTVGAILAMLRVGARAVLWSTPVVLQTASRIIQFSGLEPFIYVPPSARRKSDELLRDYIARMRIAGKPCIFLFHPSNVAPATLTEDSFLVNADDQQTPPMLHPEIRALLHAAGSAPKMLILDEVHKQASHKRWKRKVTMTEAGEEETWEANDNEAAAFRFLAHSSMFDYRLGMTATVVPDRPRNLFAIYDLVFPRCFGSSYWDFARRYCGARINPYGGMDDKDATFVEELNSRRSWMTHRPALSEVTTQMPAKTFTMRFIAQAEQRVLQTPAELNQEHRALQRGQKAGGAGRLAWELYQAAKRAAWAVADDVEHRIAQGDSVLLITQHRITATAFARYLEGRGLPVFRVVSGETHPDARQRQEAIDDWEQSRGPSILIGTGKAIGTGTDFRRPTYLGIVELPYTPLDIIQQSGRIGRMGTTDPVEVAFYLPLGTRAERVHSILLAKMPAVAAVNGDAELDSLESALGSLGDTEGLMEDLLGAMESIDFGGSDD